MSSGVSIRVLGELAITVGGRPVALPDSARARALLGWLAVNRGARPRHDIAVALWPDVPDASARQSVRSALWSLRRALGAHAETVLDTSRNRIGLRGVEVGGVEVGGVEVDLWQFDDLVADGRLDDALALQQGPLLTGIDDEWALIARDAHRDRVIALLTALSEDSAAAGDPVEALARARQAQTLDPLSETCGRMLMRRLDESGDRSVALAVYSKLVDRLRQELQIAPSSETWQLAEAIRTRARAPRRDAPIVVKPSEPSRTPLVGRDRERRQLADAWAARGGVALVCGAPGIGKTRLIRDLAAHVRADGGLAAIGTADDVRAPYAPWAELARGLLRGLGGVPEGELFVSALAPLLPTLIPPPMPGPPQLERARVLEGLLGLLEHAATRGPVLAVLEDMHACDEASAEMLARAARRLVDLPLLLAWTRRDRPVPAALAAAEHQIRQGDSAFTEVVLDRLGDAAVRELARAGGLDADAAVRVVSAADGNPLLAVEATRSLARGELTLPEGLRATVRAAASGLPASAATILAVSAVTRRPATLAEVRRRSGRAYRQVADCDDEQFAAALGSAGEAGLLQISDNVVEFRHALLRDAYYADLSEPERVRLHAVVAADLDANGGPDVAAEAARHLRAAGDRDGAARLLVNAAAHARSLGSLVLAGDLLTDAADLRPTDAMILLDLAENAAQRRRAAESDDYFDHAREFLDPADPLAIATAHQRHAQWNTGPICRPRIAMDALRTALGILNRDGIGAANLRVEILASLAWCEAVMGDPAQNDRLLADAEALRPPNPDPVQSVKIANARSLSLLRRGRFAEAAEPGRVGAALARSVGRLDLAYVATINAAAGLAASGALDAAMGMLDEALAAPADPGLQAMEAELLLSRGWLLSRLNYHDLALADARRAHRIADRIGDERLATLADAELGRTLLRAGEYTRSADLLARALATSSTEIGRSLARLQRAEALARSGRLDEASDELGAVALEPVRPSDWPDTLVARMSTVKGLIAWQRGDAGTARTELEHAAAGWRRRTATPDLGDRITATIADLGHPIIGLVAPDEELAAVLADLTRLEDTCPPSTIPR